MAKKLKKSDLRYDEGAITGKKVFLIGMIPVLIFLAIAAASAYLITDYWNKLTINQDTNDTCKYVRSQYATTLKAEYPCESKDSGTYYLVTFNENPNSSGAPANISFKVNKNDKKISPAININ